MAGRFSFGLCNDGPEILGLNDGYGNININGAALLERALSGTNFANHHHHHNVNGTLAGLNLNGLNGISGMNVNANASNGSNCMVSHHHIGLNGGNFANLNSSHFGGAVDSNSGNACSSGIGQNNFGSGVFATNSNGQILGQIISQGGVGGGSGQIIIGKGGGGNGNAYNGETITLNAFNGGGDGNQSGYMNLSDRGGQHTNIYASNDLCGNQGFNPQGGNVNVQSAGSADFSNINPALLQTLSHNISGNNIITASDYSNLAQAAGVNGQCNSVQFCTPIINSATSVPLINNQGFSSNSGNQFCFANDGGGLMSAANQCGNRAASMAGSMGLCRTGSFGSNDMSQIVPIAMQQSMPNQQPCCKCCQPQFVMQKQIVNRVPMPIRVPTPTVPRVLFTRKRCCCRRTYVL